MKAILLPLIIVFCSSAAVGFAQTFTSGDWTYTLNDSNEATIVRYEGAGGYVRFPPMLDGYPVKTVGDGQFAAQTTSVFGSSRLGSPNTTVTSVDMPDSVTRIGDGVFENCTALTNVTLPNTITLIPSWAFAYCESLVKIVIPNSVTNLSSYAFAYCSGATNILIGSSVHSINYAAFEGITGLTQLTLPASVTFLGPHVFNGCTNLKEIYFMGNAPSVQYGVFWWLPVGTVYYPSSASGWNTTFEEWPTQVYSLPTSDLDRDAVNYFRETADGTDPNDSNSFNLLSKGLVAYYPFDGNADDESGYGDQLNLVGGSLSPDRFQDAQAALVAESADGLVAESTNVMSIQGNAERTISFWVRMQVSSSESSLGAGWGNASSFGNASLFSAYGTGALNFWGHHADLNKAQEPNFIGFWRHVSFVYPGSLGAAKVYVDGREKPLTLGNQNLRGDLDTLSTTLKIAGWGFNEAQAGASIDEIRVYNRALSGAEVVQLYAVEAADLDSDNDGLDDVHETNTGTFVSATDAGTDPFDPDTSGDGITDGEAVAAQFNPLIDQRPVLNFLTQAVAAQPNRFGFYNEANVMHLGMGGLMIRKSGNAVNINLQWQTKTSLTNSWTNYGAPLPFFLNLPGSKAFIRLQATPGEP